MYSLILGYMVMKKTSTTDPLEGTHIPAALVASACQNEVEERKLVHGEVAMMYGREFLT